MNCPVISIMISGALINAVSANNPLCGIPIKYKGRYNHVNNKP